MSETIEIELRLAEARDAEQIIDLITLVDQQSPYLLVDTPITLSMQVEILNGYIQSEQSLYLLALHQDKVIGIGTVANESHPKQHHRATIGVLVHPDYWNLWIGTLLVDELITFARQSELSVLTLEVATTNKYAIQLYKTLGFETVGTLHQFLLVEDTFYDAKIMELQLNTAPKAKE